MAKKFEVKINADRCKACRLCVEFCPKSVLAMTEDRFNAKGVPFVECVKPDDCIGCRACTAVCPDAVFEIYRLEQE